MPAVTMDLTDLAPFADIDPTKAQAMIDDTIARAARVAPCILDAEFQHDAAAVAILRAAILRWHDSGGGLVQYQTAGPFAQSIDTTQTRKSLFWPTEIEELQELCRAEDTGGAFSIDTTPADPLEV